MSQRQKLVPLALGLLSAMARSYISRQYDTTVIPHDTRAGVWWLSNDNISVFTFFGKPGMEVRAHAWDSCVGEENNIIKAT